MNIIGCHLGSVTPATFQRAMDKLFSAGRSNYVILYLDDIIVFSESLEDQEKHLETVMKLLKESGLILNKSKCKLYRREVEVLGRGSCIKWLNRQKIKSRRSKLLRSQKI